MVSLGHAQVYLADHACNVVETCIFSGRPIGSPAGNNFEHTAMRPKEQRSTEQGVDSADDSIHTGQ